MNIMKNKKENIFFKSFLQDVEKTKKVEKKLVEEIIMRGSKKINFRQKEIACFVYVLASAFENLQDGIRTNLNLNLIDSMSKIDAANQAFHTVYPSSEDRKHALMRNFECLREGMNQLIDKEKGLIKEVIKIHNTTPVERMIYGVLSPLSNRTYAYNTMSKRCLEKILQGLAYSRIIENELAYKNTRIDEKYRYFKKNLNSWCLILDDDDPMQLNGDIQHYWPNIVEHDEEIIGDIVEINQEGELDFDEMDIVF